MNIFNCFQIMVTYTLLPVLTYWLILSGHGRWAGLTITIQILSCIILSMALHEATKD